MSVNVSRNNSAYGLNNALQKLAPQPIVAKRAPLSSDSAEIGTQWIYNNMIWEITAPSTWTQLALSGGSTTFSTLTVSNIQGASAGAIDIISAHTSQSATFTATNNALIGKAVLTGNTIAQNATQNIVLSNTNITATGGLIYSLSNTNVSGGSPLLEIEGATQAAGSLTIEVTNVGASGGLGTTDSITISFMVLG